MPTTTLRKPTTASAVKRAGSLLHLDDSKRLTIALAEAAAQELTLNSGFASRVRSIYGSLPASDAPAKGKEKTSPFDDLVPLKHIDGWEINLAAPPDPYVLSEVFGPDKLAIVLDRYAVAKLKDAAAMVERRNPGTKPANRSQKKPLINYIVQQVAG